MAGMNGCNRTGWIAAAAAAGAAAGGKTGRDSRHRMAAAGDSFVGTAVAGGMTAAAGGIPERPSRVDSKTFREILQVHPGNQANCKNVEDRTRC